MQTPSRTTPPPLAHVIDANAPTWPKILGIFAIVIGALSFLSALMRVGGVYVQKNQMEDMVKNDQADADVVSVFLAEFIPLQIVSGIILAALAALLLFAGIKVLKHRKVSGVLIRVWAIAYLIVGFAIAFKTYPLDYQQTLIAVKAALAESAPGDTAAEKLAMSMAKFGVALRHVIALAWVLICSLFTLIWFGRRKIRDEVKGWD